MLPKTDRSKKELVDHVVGEDQTVFVSGLTLGRETDWYIKKQGPLNGLMIVAEKFPGWQDIQGLVAHIQFVRDHHKKVKKVAFVSDSKFFEFIPQLAEHFESAEVRHLDSADEQSEMVWLYG